MSGLSPDHHRPQFQGKLLALSGVGDFLLSCRLPQFAVASGFAYFDFDRCGHVVSSVKNSRSLSLGFQSVVHGVVTRVSLPVRVFCTLFR